MAELTPIPSARAASDANYQPTSAYAGRCVAAGLFTLILLVLLRPSRRAPRCGGSFLIP